GQGDGDIEAGQPIEAERKPEREADTGRKGDLPEPSCKRDRSESSDKAPVELETDQKKEECDTEFGEKADLVRRLGTAIDEGGGTNPDRDEAHNYGLAQGSTQQPDGGSSEQQPCDLMKDD